MWVALSAQPQRSGLHVSQRAHLGQRHLCGAAHSHAVSSLYVGGERNMRRRPCECFRMTLSFCRLQLPPVVPATSSAWTAGAASWTPTSSQSAAASLTTEVIDARLISARTTAGTEAHAHPLMSQVTYEFKTWLLKILSCSSSNTPVLPQAPLPAGARQDSQDPPATCTHARITARMEATAPSVLEISPPVAALLTS